MLENRRGERWILCAVSSDTWHARCRGALWEWRDEMRIACSDTPACERVLGVLQRHGVTSGVRWEGGSPLDERTWIVVTVPLDPAVEAAIRRDIDFIAGAAVQD